MSDSAIDDERAAKAARAKALVGLTYSLTHGAHVCTIVKKQTKEEGGGHHGIAKYSSTLVTTTLYSRFT
jgi:hypothetical protein